MEKVSESVSQSDQAEADSAKHNAVLARYLMGVLTVLGILIAGALIVLAQTSIVTPLTMITRALDRLASGDLKTQVPAVKSEDEIGRMARALSIFKDEMLGRQSEVEARKARDQADAERAATKNNSDKAFQEIDKDLEKSDSRPVSQAVPISSLNLVEVDNAEYKKRRAEALEKPGAVVGRITVAN
jgi:methyl-accepting chemotaxis protein